MFFLDLKKNVFPTDLECSLSLEVMQMPVLSPSGHSYEKAAFTQWLSNSATDPKTSEKIEKTWRGFNLLTNKPLKEVIDIVQLHADRYAKTILASDKNENVEKENRLSAADSKFPSLPIKRAPTIEKKINYPIVDFKKMRDLIQAGTYTT